jgi:hypothetical protein
LDEQNSAVRQSLVLEAQNIQRWQKSARCHVSKTQRSVRFGITLTHCENDHNRQNQLRDRGIINLIELIGIA